MKIQVLGTGCKKCQKLYENVQQAIKDMGLEQEIEKVEDMETIADMGVLMTPALAIDGNVKVSGKVLSVDEIKKIF